MERSNYEDIHRFVSILFTMLLMGFLATCSPPMQTYRLYQGPQMPSGETAQILGKGERIQIISVNGMKSPDGKDTFGNVRLEIVPGVYHLTVSFSGESSTLVPAGLYYYYIFYRHDSLDNVDITLKAEPGHTYSLSSTHDYEKSTWHVVVRDATDDRIILKEGPFSLNKIRRGDDQAQMRRYGP
jgi:hypothetical protein